MRREGCTFGASQPLQYSNDAVPADFSAPRNRPERVIRAQPHREVNVVGRCDFILHCTNRFVDDRTDRSAEKEPRAIPNEHHAFADRFEEFLREFERIVEMAKQAGIDPPFGEANPDEMAFLTPDEDVTTTIDCVDVIGRKRDALRAHRSQISEDWPQLSMPDDVLKQFADEYFQLVISRKPATLPETDLFAGITPQA